MRDNANWFVLRFAVWASRRFPRLRLYGLAQRSMGKCMKQPLIF